MSSPMFEPRPDTVYRLEPYDRSRSQDQNRGLCKVIFPNTVRTTMDRLSLWYNGVQHRQ
jgi:hypothetical protein